MNLKADRFVSRLFRRMTVLMMIVLVAAGSASAGEFPPQVVARIYRLEMAKALGAGDSDKAIEAAEKILAMRGRITIEPEFMFEYAGHLLSAGRFERASEVITAYLEDPGPFTSDIDKGLIFLSAIDAARERAQLARQAEELARQAEEMALVNARNFEKKTVDVNLTDSVVMVFQMIPAGTFIMGSPASELGDEVQHQVTLTKPFYLGIYEVTQEQWQAVMGNNPSRFKGGKKPVEQVSWNDATEFCRKASQMTGRKFRLPTEAEWEYACRAGTTTAYNTGDSLGENQANYNSRQTREVGSYSPNAWGLYDMHGNVWEWCSDWYGDYPNGSVSDPKGPGNGRYRVLRGGSWLDAASYCRSANRGWNDPGFRGDRRGFRIALDP